MKLDRREKIKTLFKKRKAQGKLTSDYIFEVIDAVDRKARIETLEQIKTACDKKIGLVNMEEMV